MDALNKTAPVHQHNTLIEWHAAARPAAGEAVSGDMHVVKAFDHGALIAVVDGLGHGGEANVAARIAIAVLEKHAGESVITLVQRCHMELTKTRGAALTVATLDALENTVTWLGVGNVEGRLLRGNTNTSHSTESVLLRSGLVGYQLPALRVSIMPLSPGDLLILATDGVHAGFDNGINRGESPDGIAERILKQYFKGIDDALILVARYVGMRHERAITPSDAALRCDTAALPGR